MGLECYVALLYVDGKTPWTKVYGAGEGVQPLITSPWYLDGEFGGESTNRWLEKASKLMISRRRADHSERGLAGTVDKKVVLSIHKCRMREGTALGSGHLLTADVAGMEEVASARFVWQYLTSPEHVSALGLGSTETNNDIPAVSPRPSNSASPFSPAPGSLEAAADPANAFLRRANSLLLSLLTPTQKLDFLSNLAESPSLAPYISEASRGELNAMLSTLGAEVTSGVQTPTATKLLPRRADSAPVTASAIHGVENDGPATRLSIGALAGARRPDPLSVEAIADGGSFHLRPPGIRSPSRPSPARPSSPRKSPLSDSLVQVGGEQGGAMEAEE